MAKKKEYDPYEIITDVSFQDEAEGAIDSDADDVPKSKKPSGRAIFSDEFDDTKAILPKREEERLLNIYGAILVKEFGPEDKHHSEEQDPLMKRGAKIPMFSGTMVGFVKACREYIDVLFEYAEKQKYMPRDLFLTMVENGSWSLDWLNKPDMNKYLRKKASYESLLPYIVDPYADLAELEYLDTEREIGSTSTRDDIDFSDPDQLERYRRETYPPDVYDKLFNDVDPDDVPIYSDAVLPDKYRIHILDDSESRDVVKRYPAMFDAMKGFMKKKAQAQSSHGLFGGFASRYRSAEEEFELIERFEEVFGDENDRPPKFDIENIMGDENEDALDEYFAAVDEYIDTHELWEDNRGRTLTKREYLAQQIRDIYESKGINVRKFVNFSELDSSNKVKITLRDPEPTKPQNKKEKIEDLIYKLYLKNRDRIDKYHKKQVKKAKKRREFNDRYFGGGYVGDDEMYYYDYAGDALDEAIEHAGNQAMKEFFGEDRWKNVRDMVVDMSDMSWDHLMGRDEPKKKKKG